MNAIKRLVHEYSNLAAILSPADTAKVLVQTVRHASTILKTGKLTSVDRAITGDVVVRFHKKSLHVPLSAMDGVLAASGDSPTFCGIREMLGNDVYLRAFQLPMQCDTVVDMGSNRGMFSLAAAMALGAKQVIEIEPDDKYQRVRDLLNERNGVTMTPARYWKFVGTAEQEARDGNIVSMDTIVRENGLSSIDFAKIDIEGAEAEIFREAEWLSITKNFAAELHPHWVDVKPVAAAAKANGFEVRITDQFGVACEIDQAMFLYGSRVGALKG